MSAAIELAGADEAISAIAALPGQLQTALRAKADALADLLRRRIRTKLSGEMLKQRSGALAGGIEVAVEATDGKVAIVASMSEGVPYAAIQENGGVTAPHDILPDKAKALAFLRGGKEIFAMTVHHPGSRIPARPYLASSVAELADQLTAGLGSELIDEVLG